MLKMEAKKLYIPATHKRSSTLVQKLCSGAMLVAKVHQPGVLDVIIADIILHIGPLLKTLQWPDQTIWDRTRLDQSPFSLLHRWHFFLYSINFCLHRKLCSPDQAWRLVLRQSWQSRASRKHRLAPESSWWPRLSFCISAISIYFVLL